MPMAISIIWDMIRYPKKSKKMAELISELDEVLGLNIDILEQKEIELPEEIVKLVEERKKAREEKNFELSDKIRDIIQEKGYIIKDYKGGMKIELDK